MLTSRLRKFFGPRFAFVCLVFLAACGSDSKPDDSFVGDEGLLTDQADDVVDVSEASNEQDMAPAGDEVGGVEGLCEASLPSVSSDMETIDFGLIRDDLSAERSISLSVTGLDSLAVVLDLVGDRCGELALEAREIALTSENPSVVKVTWRPESVTEGSQKLCTIVVKSPKDSCILLEISAVGEAVEPQILVVPMDGVYFDPPQGDIPSIGFVEMVNIGVVPFSLLKANIIWDKPGEPSQYYIESELDLPKVFAPGEGLQIKLGHTRDPANVERGVKLSLKIDYGTEPTLVDLLLKFY
ncbi:MAG TPA: hypothetical protein GX737_02655 [Oligoflexales bacterium]|nr:hypothetical protein [Oligoflexales bacterium]